ncbi:formate dehydrogenase subunit delta [Variovorax sp. TBS-050B]|uniref:formate dehydrogenase subunit delta n=1 Tax=Variovorax sp. TBS-050B TaxID=2940551 RepID=UPI002476AE12|nr:formate dehydrogenase subunit delta [Variovorax sp. TBS-050B]MDH6594136.1 formate dehydrogenase subunit delta [Variovorax sp. TBS-050B]
MHIDHLIRMVNQIGSFFEAMPDRDEALRDLALHLQRFWEPRMRRELLAHLDAAGTDALNPVSAEAIRVHRAMLA